MSHKNSLKYHLYTLIYHFKCHQHSTKLQFYLITSSLSLVIEILIVIVLFQVQNYLLKHQFIIFIQFFLQPQIMWFFSKHSLISTFIFHFISFFQFLPTQKYFQAPFMNFLQSSKLIVSSYPFLSNLISKIIINQHQLQLYIRDIS